MKTQNKLNQQETQQGSSTSDRMHENGSPRAQTKKQGISNSGGQGSYETSNKHTARDQKK